MLPRVEASSSMKEYSPMRIVLTPHTGFQLSGWKSLLLKHSLCPVLNLPLGVYMSTDGGFRGYLHSTSSNDMDLKWSEEQLQAHEEVLHNAHYTKHRNDLRK